MTVPLGLMGREQGLGLAGDGRSNHLQWNLLPSNELQ
jgi:hypothetical protein